jgi:hypothetical protein
MKVVLMNAYMQARMMGVSELYVLETGGGEKK